MTTTDPKLIERIARAMCREEVHYGDPERVIQSRVDYEWKEYAAKATAILPIVAAAINEAVQKERAGRMDHWTMRAALKSIRALVKAGDALSFAAQTTGGTAGSDTHLMVANLHWCAERDKHLQALRIIELEHDDPEIGAGILAPPAIEAKESQP